MPTSRSLWPILAAVAAFAVGAASFANNLGGARNAVCSLPALNASCVTYGLVAAPVNPDAARATMLKKVEGLWGNASKDGAAACTTTLRYSVTHRGLEDFIVVRGADGVNQWESVGRVASVGEASIFTRTLTPATETGTQWELRLEDDRLIQVDKDGVATPLVKCGG